MEIKTYLRRHRQRTRYTIIAIAMSKTIANIAIGTIEYITNHEANAPHIVPAT